MAKLSDIFPSRFLSAADLQGREAIATIDRVEIEKFDDDAQKPVVYFEGKTKGLVCNKTNAKSIELIAGDDTDNWPGAAIILFPMMVDFKGQVVEEPEEELEEGAEEAEGEEGAAEGAPTAEAETSS